MTTELLARSIIYTLCGLAVLGAAFWWGWDQRTKLALKLEFFSVTNKQWNDYDRFIQKNGHPPKKGHVLHLASGTIDGANE